MEPSLPCLKDLLNIIERGLHSDNARPCQNTPGKPSGPAAEDLLHFFKYLNIANEDSAPKAAKKIKTPPRP